MGGNHKMKFKKSMFLLCLIIFLISITGTSAVDSNDTVVSDDDSTILEESHNEVIESSQDNLLSADNPGTFTELELQIILASNGSTIKLDKDYAYNDGFLNKTGILIDKSLTIDGAGHTIDGLSKSRIFTIFYGLKDNNKVILKNIKFKNGYTDGYGGAILNFADLTVDNCDFTNNNAYYCGGAINSLGHLVCKNSNFNKNTAGGDAGAIFTFSVKSSAELYRKILVNRSLEGDILLIIELYANVTLEHLTDVVNNCVFTNNVAKGRGGGAIYAYSHIDISSSKFNSNKAGEKGGAVFGNKNLYISNSKFTGNSVSKYGGAVYFRCHDNGGHYEGKEWVSEVNYYTNLIQGSTFTKNVASKGGAIYGFKSSSSDKHGAKAVKCTFTANKASKGRDIYGGSSSQCVFNYLKVTLKSVTIKKSAKKLVLTAKLTKGKSLIKGKKITFKFNGKTYKAKTNKKGIAKVTIKKSVLKKLKIGKKIKYTAKYGSLKVTKTAKVRK